MNVLKIKKNDLKILCLGSHPDDIEIGCGGSILKLTSNYNTNIKWVVFSSNDKREQEAINSAEKFLSKSKKKNIIIHKFKENYFPYNSEIKDYFYTLQDFNPDLIFTHYKYDAHQDHKSINQLTWNTFRNNMILEYEIPKYDRETSNPNFYINLDEETCREKIKHIIDNFQSQKNKHWFNEKTLWSILILRGIESKSDSKYSEGFSANKIAI
jgi:LmbE family N-acetylglucosaminyl deacetylase